MTYLHLVILADLRRAELLKEAERDRVADAARNQRQKETRTGFAWRVRLVWPVVVSREPRVGTVPQ